MAYVIVTKQTANHFDDVGLNNRRPYRLKTLRGVINRALRTKFCGPGDKMRIEWFTHHFDVYPYKTQYHNYPE